MLEFLKAYWPILLVAAFYGIKIWRDRKITEIIEKALDWLMDWAEGELGKVTEADVRSATGYFYDVILDHLPPGVAPVIKLLIPKKHVQDMAWDWWQKFIAPPANVVFGR